MAKLTINRGSTANDGTGDNLRDGANKVNLNFDEIYTAIGDGTTVNGTIKVSDDSSTVTTLSANGETLRILGGTAINSTLSGNTLTIAADTSSLLTASGTTTLTNKTINGPDNTLTNIANSSLSNSSISITGDDSSAQTISLGGGILFTGGSGITTSISGNEITFATDGSIVTETSTDTLTNKTINGPDNTLTNIANSSLTNNSVTIGADTISLGGTQTTITDLNLDGTSSLSGTGTISTTGSGNKIRFNYATDGDFPTAATYEGMFAWDTADSTPFVADDGGWIEILTENSSVSKHSDVNIGGISAGNVLVWNAGGYFEPGSAGGFSAGSDLDQAGADIQDIGYIGHRSPDATVTQTLLVTVAAKTSEHTAFGDGSSNGYKIDGHEGPHLQLSRGVYKFDLSGSSSSHPFRLYEDEGKNIQYTTGVTTSGSGGSAGDHLTITIDDNTVTPLFYQCTAHSNMGGRIDILGGKRRRLNITTDKTNTGNGSTTAFTCLANRTVDDVLVIVNGLVLTPTDDYTISGTTLTFTTAPASSAEIVFRYLG